MTKQKRDSWGIYLQLQQNEKSRQETNQKDLDSSQNVHGSCKGGAQVETQAHCTSKLWTQRATDHEVGSAG